MYYKFYEMSHAALVPARTTSEMFKHFYKNPLNPVSHTFLGRQMAAMCEMFERTTRRYGKPEFGITKTVIEGKSVKVLQKGVWKKPFCELLHFERKLPKDAKPAKKLLIVAPMSGHYATLLRGTVETMLEYCDVYITDWVDARMVPYSDGTFSLDSYIEYLIEMIHFLGKDVHLMAVCQPSVPVMAAVALMNARKDPFAPASMTLMGGPIDTRENPTSVNELAQRNGIHWFRDNVIMTIPFPLPGFMRDVYPGFLQLSGFMSMNLDRHLTAYGEFFNHLVDGDGDSAEKHREFYDEYMAVMDLDAEFYLQTVETVFIKHSLPKGEMMHYDERIDCSKITKTALMTVEGEKDDISGIGQTKAAHKLCSKLPAARKVHYEQKGVGHYGVFNGSRFRKEIAPRIAEFIKAN